MTHDLVSSHAHTHTHARTHARTHTPAFRSIILKYSQFNVQIFLSLMCPFMFLRDKRGSHQETFQALHCWLLRQLYLLQVYSTIYIYIHINVICVPCITVQIIQTAEIIWVQLYCAFPIIAFLSPSSWINKIWCQCRGLCVWEGESMKTVRSGSAAHLTIDFYIFTVIML